MSRAIGFRPRLFDCLKNYNRRKLISDVLAGVTVGIVALPLAMAFGIASGVTPQAGIFTAVIAGFLISALGGSRVQIGGPTGAFVVIVSGIIAQYGLANLLICTVMAGIILVIMGVVRMGSAIKFIPLPITFGFTNGIAVLIFSTQIKDFFGLKLDPVPSEFFAKITALWHSLATFNPVTLGVAVGSLLIIVFWPVPWRKILPGSIVAVIAGTLTVTLFHLQVETIGSRFGEIPQGLPPFHLPGFSWSHFCL
jgi:sulfate permease, SulP family